MFRYLRMNFVVPFFMAICAMFFVFVPVAEASEFVLEDIFVIEDDLMNLNGLSTLRVVFDDAVEFVYVLGTFDSEVDFDPSEGQSLVSPVGSRDIFIAKYDLNNFDNPLVWLNTYGSSGFDKGTGIVLKDDALYISGSYADVIDFDPDTPGNSFDDTHSGFILTLNTDGVYQSVIRTHSVGTSTFGSGIDLHAVNENLNLFYIRGVGTFQDDDPENQDGEINFSTESFIALNFTGGYEWHVPFSGLFKIIENENNFWVVASFNGSMDLDPGVENFVVTSAGSNDVVFANYSYDGNFLQGFTVGGTGNETIQTVFQDEIGNFYLSMPFFGDSDLFPDYVNKGFFDTALLKIDQDGDIVWTYINGTTGWDYIYNIVQSSDGTIYTVGTLAAGATVETANGSVDIANANVLTFSEEGVLLNAYNIPGVLAVNGGSFIGVDNQNLDWYIFSYIFGSFEYQDIEGETLVAGVDGQDTFLGAKFIILGDENFTQPIVENQEITTASSSTSSGSGIVYCTATRTQFCQPVTVTETSVPQTNNTPSPVVADSGICEPYIVVTSPIGLNRTNDPALVTKIQEFLVEYTQANIPVTGVYDLATEQAVRQFQQQYVLEILAPWGVSTPTGVVYTTTSAKMNAIVCGEVLGCPVFTQLTKPGDTNSDVPLIKNFLNVLLRKNLDTNSNVLDDAAVAAVREFQTRYKDFVLQPWSLASATGWWYQTTSRQANKFMGCELPPITLPNGVVVE